MDHIARNYKLLEEKMLEHMDVSLNFGKELIESELDAGFLNLLVKPVVRSFYQMWSSNHARIGTIEQIKITLDSAKELISNGEINEEKFNAIIKKNFPIYLKNDQTDQQCHHRHKNYPKLEEITRQSFITQVEECVLLLNVKEDVNSYNELSKAAFKTREKALNALKRQLDFNEKGIEILEQDDSILKVFAGKNVIMTVLRKGFEKTKQFLITDLSNIFNIH
jgi:hypothetical protein